MIELRNITLRVGSFSLLNVSLKVNSGEFDVLLGPSGSGKTLLIEIIAGLIKSDEGEVLLFDKKVTGIGSERRKISYLPQDHALFPNKNVFENIAFGLKLQKQDSVEIKKQLERIGTSLSISHLLDRSVNNLSTGEQQRVALARALVVRNSILLLDEPTSSLDESMQEDFCMLLKRIQREYNLTVLMTTHHKDSAFLVGDNLHFIAGGRVYLDVCTQDIFKISLPLQVAKLIGIENFFSLSRTTEENKYFCEELNRTLIISTIPKETPGKFLIGVRSEDVRVVRPEDNTFETPNKFEAIVKEIFFKENDAIVLLQIPGSGFSVKMQISIYNLRKMSIVLGAQITLKLKEELLRVIYS